MIERCGEDDVKWPRRGGDEKNQERDLPLRDTS